MQSTLEPSETPQLFPVLQQGAAYLKQRGLPAPRLEAELLLGDLLSLERMALYLSPEKALSLTQYQQFQKHLARRAASEPLQYITGEVEFCDFSLLIRSGVFIPRPETELILEETKNLLPQPKYILDLCTGSGALAIALSRQFPSASVWASDISEAALTLAEENIQRHQLSSRIHLLKGDLFEALETCSGLPARFDLIVCNPPYIAEKDRASLPPEVRDYEPETALFAPEEGCAFYRRILLEVPRFMGDKARLLFEMGAGQSSWLRAFVAEHTALDLHFTRDWADIERIAQLSKQGISDG